MVSAISLGTEYLIDLPSKEAARVIRHAILSGINYFDLFWAKPSFRDIMGAAFEGHRDKVMLAAHLGSVQIDGQYETVRDRVIGAEFFEDFLNRYRTSYADVLFLHNSDGKEDYDEIMKPGGLKDLALEYKAAGKARYIGFSGHTAETAIEAARSGYVDVLMFPINIAGNSVPGRQDLLKACADNDVGLVAMKIFGGGKLLQEWTSAEMNRWELGGSEKTVDRTTPLNPVEGLHYALSQIGVSTVVPGCKTVAELSTDLAYFDASESAKDYSEKLSDIKQFQAGDCVYCNHCLPCPSRIDIGATIRLLETAAGDLTDELQQRYRDLPNPASDCIECGDCESRCPFGVEVIPKMKNAAMAFE
jgi:uncharacterized protein